VRRVNVPPEEAGASVPLGGEGSLAGPRVEARISGLASPADPATIPADEHAIAQSAGRSLEKRSGRKPGAADADGGTGVAVSFRKNAQAKRSSAGDSGSRLRRLSDEEKKTYARVSPNKPTREAVRDSHTRGGKLYDAVTGQKIKPGTPWVMGHKEGFELRKMQVDAADRKISRKEFIEEQNNPNIYQTELPSTSSRRKHEAPDHITLPQSAAGGAHQDKY
jgi:hypothetical protein